MKQWNTKHPQYNRDQINILKSMLKETDGRTNKVKGTE
jgi:hypothetical protein